MNAFALRSLPLGVRLALVCLCGVLGIGLAASLQHLRWHYEKRDERPGFTMDDVTGAYHGMQSVAPLRVALERGHPETTSQADREALLDWLLGKKDAAGKRPKQGNPSLGSDYDSIDLGDKAPIELIRANCLECHAKSAAATHAIAKQFPLDSWDDVRGFAISREINPTDPKKLAISIHAHALSLGVMALVVSGLFWCTAWPRKIVSAVILVTCAGLLADFVGQLAARDYVAGVWFIMAGGAAANGLMGLMLLAVVVDVIRPARKEA
ncbi:hypothetical protein PHYC_00643 [Phycisphaerales bacterium]|nr:hypothetical protein PHYC_00643 [Phycisphaerales bacterium]